MNIQPPNWGEDAPDEPVPDESCASLGVLFERASRSKGWASPPPLAWEAHYHFSTFYPSSSHAGKSERRETTILAS